MKGFNVKIFLYILGVLPIPILYIICIIGLFTIVNIKTALTIIVINIVGFGFVALGIYCLCKLSERMTK